MTGVLVAGFVLGLWHAFDADHIGAMITLVASRDSSTRQAVSYSLLWGAGHALTLSLMALLVVRYRVEVSGEVASMMEFMVGLMLVLLALDMLRRVGLIRMHSHVHSHVDQMSHDHIHVHFHPESPEHESHTHVHVGGDGFRLRALLVGLMHGMAGSAALLLLVLNTVTSGVLAFIYVILFSLGAMTGMAALTLVVSAQLRWPGRRSFRIASRVRGCAAIVVLSIGVFLMSKTAADPGILQAVMSGFSPWH